ncbi:hypothetical protein ACFFIX_10915 [Metabacillus herbersteinensis]|uniref:UPF0738 protein ACFFIX_10915 n=1 Tax=Metabacillus herbersteinensis TaxID=283816 RepID=A0ABV6GGB4_9BACI
MVKRIEITEAMLKEQKLVLHTQDFLVDEKELQARGQMLVDSNSLAFIYILENNDEFVYVSLPHTIWPSLNEARISNCEIALLVNEKELILVDLLTELSYLLENIQGNANYGEQMEEKVVELFQLDK